MKEFFLAVIGTVIMMMLVHHTTPKAQTLGIESNPLNYDNIQLNPKNSPLDYNNSFLNPENSYLNPEANRVIYANDGMPMGYMVDGKNLFNTDGERVGYRAKR
jgi:hypothetical protein